MKESSRFTKFQKFAWGDGSGVPVPPNLGGERVVRTNKPAKVKVAKAKVGDAGDGGGFSTRRALILGVLAQPVFFGIANWGKGGLIDLPKQTGKISQEEVVDSYYDGNAVSSPALEIDLLELLEEKGRMVGTDPKRDAEAAQIVTTLEARGGTQLGAAKGQGRWVLPWVGGWERVWTNTADASFLGGPSSTSFGKRGVNLDQVSARQFIYGPGEGGVCVEYLHAFKQDASAPLKFLLTRPGTVTNLGDGIFQLDFPTALDEYEVAYEPTRGIDRLVDCKETLNADGSPTGLKQCFPIDGGAERAAPVSTLLVKTSYLSERLWILKDAKDESKVAVFTRTETRSVMDRRGLIADGQLKPSDDEAVRYGKLLFGESIQDYSAWDGQQAKLKAEKDKLLSK